MSPARMRDRSARVFVAGHGGMVGSALVRRLRALGYTEILTQPRAELDLLDQQAVDRFFADHAVDQVYLAAAKVGGIHANNVYPAEFIYENLQVQTNVIHAAHRHGVPRLMFLGSSCVYPRMAPQPIPEEALGTSQLEPTNEPYALAKIAGIKLCESYNRQYGRDYRSCMPTNLYGPGDNFHPRDSHVIPALIRRFDDAVRTNAGYVEVWGTGWPRREFMHVDDMAAATVHLMELPTESLAPFVRPTRSHVNVGTGVDVSIRDLVALIADLTGFTGEIRWDASKPDGMPRKLLNVSALQATGWNSCRDLRVGLAETIAWFRAHPNDRRE